MGAKERDVLGLTFPCVPLYKPSVSISGIEDISGIPGPPGEVVDVPNAGREVAEQHTHPLPLPMEGKQLHHNGACAFVNQWFLVPVFFC